MANFIAAIDQGTTSTRFIVFDHDGNIVAVDQKEHKQIYPGPGLVEHDALEIWTNTQEVITNAMRKSGLSSTDIAALGITNQRETTVLWNKTTGKPYANAVVWQDTRTSDFCSELEKNENSDLVRKITGLPISTYFSGPKIKWLLEKYPEIYKDAQQGLVLFGNMDTWLIWNLTGGPQGGIHVTDVTNASRTMLMNINTLEWDAEMLAKISIPASVLPRIVSSSDVYGYTSKTLDRVPIAGDLGDQQSA